MTDISWMQGKEAWFAANRAMAVEHSDRIARALERIADVLEKNREDKKGPHYYTGNRPTPHDYGSGYISPDSS